MLRTSKLSEPLASMTAAISAAQPPDGADGSDLSSAQWIEGVGKGVFGAAVGVASPRFELGTESTGKFDDSEVGRETVGAGGEVHATTATTSTVRQTVRVAVSDILGRVSPHD